MRDVMQAVGMILFLFGMAAVDSVNIFIPAAIMFTGAVVVLLTLSNEIAP